LTQALLSAVSFPLPHRSTSEISGSFDCFCDTMGCSDFPTPSIAGSDLAIFSARRGSPSFSAECWDLPVPFHEVSSHAEGLRPRRFPTSLALSICGLLPSASLNGVGTTAWMFDETICVSIRCADRPIVDCQALLRLAQLLDLGVESLGIGRHESSIAQSKIASEARPSPNGTGAGAIASKRSNAKRGSK
jgi:hypothetical protein